MGLNCSLLIKFSFSLYFLKVSDSVEGSLFLNIPKNQLTALSPNGVFCEFKFALLLPSVLLFSSACLFFSFLSRLFFCLQSCLFLSFLSRLFFCLQSCLFLSFLSRLFFCLQSCLFLFLAFFSRLFFCLQSCLFLCL